MGGSATRAHLLQKPAAPRTWRASGGNLALDREAALDVLLPLLRSAAPDAVCIGLAGARTAPDAVAWLSEELGPQARRVTLMTDANLALMAAFGADADGIVLCAGTGSVAVVRHAGATHLVGGHGFLFGDGGSAYDIGRRLIAAALRDRDRGARSLSNEVEAMLGESVDAFVRRACAEPGNRPPLAHLARKVPAMRHPAGHQILTEAAEDLVDLVNTARGRFGPLPVRLIGGVFRIPIIAETMRQRCGAALARTRPEVAAARLAAEASG
jgi:N-acetylglucosamine kinase-like BadF-type ATPase